MKREELWTPSVRRFECLLKAAQNGDYNAYMSLMARFFKVMEEAVLVRKLFQEQMELLSGMPQVSFSKRREQLSLRFIMLFKIQKPQ